MKNIDMDAFKEVSIKDLKYAEEMAEKGEYQESYSTIMVVLEKLPKTDADIVSKVELIKVLTLLLLILIAKMEIEE